MIAGNQLFCIRLRRELSPSLTQNKSLVEVSTWYQCEEEGIYSDVQFRKDFV